MYFFHTDAPPFHKLKLIGYPYYTRGLTTFQFLASVVSGFLSFVMRYRLALGTSGSGQQMKKVLADKEDAGHRNSEEHDEQPSRRRKVRLSPFPPSGENSARSLAPPLPTKHRFVGSPLFY